MKKGTHLSTATKRLLREKNIGKQLSQDTRKKIGLGLVGRPVSNETRRKIGDSNRGKPRSDGTILKNSLAHMGKKQTEETIKKRVAKLMGHVGYMLGKHHSEKTKQRMSEAQVGRKHSEESKQKMRIARLFRVFPIRDTKIERMIQDELSLRGYAYYRHYPTMGQPDIAFPDQRVVIFCDGDWWHANPKRFKENDVMKNGKQANEIWTKDNKVTRWLQERGWCVLRYWESEILLSPTVVVDEIEDVLFRGII